MTFKTGNKRGEQKKAITVTSNDPQNPDVQLHVMVDIEIQFGFENLSLNFGKVRKEKSVSKLAYIVAKDPSSLSLERLTSSSDYVTAKVVEQSGESKSDGKLAVEVTVLPGLPLGRINVSVVAKSVVDTFPQTTLRITGAVIGDVEVSPESVRFLVMKNAGNSVMPDSHKVKIINHSNTWNLTVTDIRDPDDRMDFDLVTVQEGKLLELILRPKDASSITGAVNGTITIVTDHPEQKELTIRYTLTLQS